MNTFKNSRYYIFANETTIWYKNRVGTWKVVVNECHNTRESPWGLATDKAIMQKCDRENMKFATYTRKELDEYLFLKEL
ncbi:MAG: hypothetical protein GY861_29310 [bacterium]|nr:hypothetical protein [bacterium]